MPVNEEFNLIKRDLVNQVTRNNESILALSIKMEAHTAEECKSNKKRDEMIDKLNHIIIGNGKPGLAEDVRILGKDSETRKGHNKIFYSAIAMGFGEWVWRTIGHFFK